MHNSLILFRRFDQVLEGLNTIMCLGRYDIQQIIILMERRAGPRVQ